MATLFFLSKLNTIKLYCVVFWICNMIHLRSRDNGLSKVAYCHPHQSFVTISSNTSGKNLNYQCFHKWFCFMLGNQLSYLLFLFVQRYLTFSEMFRYFTDSAFMSENIYSNNLAILFVINYFGSWLRGFGSILHFTV